MEQWNRADLVWCRQMTRTSWTQSTTCMSTVSCLELVGGQNQVSGKRNIFSKSGMPRKNTLISELSVVFNVVSNVARKLEERNEFPIIVDLDHCLIEQDIQTFLRRKITWPIWALFFSHVVPSEHFIQYMVNNFQGKVLLSIGCGTGLIEYMLRHQGLAVIATDKFAWCVQFLPILQLDAVEAVKKFNDCDVLVILWSTTDGYDADALAEFSGSHVILVSEDSTCPFFCQVTSNRLWKTLLTNWKLENAMLVFNCDKSHCRQMMYQWQRRASS